MGIYPDRTTKPLPTIDGKQRWMEIVSDSAVIRRRVVTAEPWEEERVDCFCCTCDAADAEGHYSSMSDPACRNHGFAAKRPCDIHGMPGSPWDREMELETGWIGPEAMPMPVQAYRDAVKAGARTR